MASSLNVIALISGGKDSFFSILHCQANGHSVVALANLHPPHSDTVDDDLNSYMYQTAGHRVIPLYEKALGIPLYRQEITGTAVNSSRDYATPLLKQEQDETEDLVPLLKRVLAAHPEANAVSTGAILSTYQRTRVESVALRLGLTPLSYLWQYPLLEPYTQSSLLHDMANMGQKAVIIKTASGGLDENFLGLDVAAPKTIVRLSKAMSRYGKADDGAILGEGGEFETLALDGPGQLWKRRIIVETGPPDILEGGQTMQSITACTLEDKVEDKEESAGLLRIPGLLDDEFKAILEASSSAAEQDDAALLEEPYRADTATESTAIWQNLLRNTINDTPTLLTYFNITSDLLPTTVLISPSRQLTKIFLRLDSILKERQLPRSRITHCTLLLRDMADFTVLNPIYGQYFNEVNPPARVTIALGETMPKNVDVMLSVIADKDEKDGKGSVTRCTKRQGLHVQGRSYWAPANIGPYSQAISAQLPLTDTIVDVETHDAGAVVYVAGQIPLIPSSMEVYNTHGFHGQATLSLQHLWRIGRAQGVKWWTAGVAFIPTCTNPVEKVRIAQETWTAIHTPSTSTSKDEDEDADLDPWDRLNRTHASNPFSAPFNDTTHRAPLPDRTAISHASQEDVATPAQAAPPCFVAQVSSLPRSVDIEWSATGLTAPRIDFSRHCQDSQSYNHRHMHTATSLAQSEPVASRARFYALEVGGMADVDAVLEGWRGVDGEDRGAWANATVYVGRGWEGGDVGGQVLEDVKLRLRGVQWVVCQRVWGEGGREVKGAVVGRVERGAVGGG